MINGMANSFSATIDGLTNFEISSLTVDELDTNDITVSNNLTVSPGGTITLPNESILDAYLSSNVALKNAANSFTQTNTFPRIDFTNVVGTKLQYFTGYTTEIQSTILRHNVPTGTTQRFAINTIDMMTITLNEINLNPNSTVGGRHLILYTHPSNPNARNGMIGFNGNGLRYSVGQIGTSGATMNGHIFQIATPSSIDILNLNELGINMLTGSINLQPGNAVKIYYNGITGGYYIEITSTPVLRTRVPTGNSHALTIDSVDVLSLSATAMTLSAGTDMGQSGDGVILQTGTGTNTLKGTTFSAATTFNGNVTINNFELIFPVQAATKIQYYGSSGGMSTGVIDAGGGIFLLRHISTNGFYFMVGGQDRVKINTADMTLETDLIIRSGNHIQLNNTFNSTTGRILLENDDAILFDNAGGAIFRTAVGVEPMKVGSGEVEVRTEFGFKFVDFNNPSDYNSIAVVGSQLQITNFSPNGAVEYVCLNSTGSASIMALRMSFTATSLGLNVNFQMSGSGIITQLIPGGSGTNILKNTDIDGVFSVIDAGNRGELDMTGSAFSITNKAVGGDLKLMVTSTANVTSDAIRMTETETKFLIDNTNVMTLSSTDATLVSDISLQQSGTGIINQAGTGTNILKNTDINGLFRVVDGGNRGELDMTGTAFSITNKANAGDFKLMRTSTAGVTTDAILMTETQTKFLIDASDVMVASLSSVDIHTSVNIDNGFGIFIYGEDPVEVRVSNINQTVEKLVFDNQATSGITTFLVRNAAPSIITPLTLDASNVTIGGGINLQMSSAGIIDQTFTTYSGTNKLKTTDVSGNLTVIGSIEQSGTAIINQSGTGTNELKNTDINGTLTVTGSITAGGSGVALLPSTQTFTNTNTFNESIIMKKALTLPPSSGYTAPTDTQLGGRLTSSTTITLPQTLVSGTEYALGTCVVGPGVYIINCQFALQCTASGAITKEEYSINTSGSPTITTDILEIVNHSSFTAATNAILCKRLTAVHTYTSASNTIYYPVIRLTFSSGTFRLNTTSQNTYVKLDVNRIA